MPPPTPVDVSVVIVTRDRKDVLRGVLDSLLHQTVPAELLVLDDASRDGTFEMLSREFPGVRGYRRDEPRGCVARRTEAAQLAGGSVIVFLDDDIEISS